ncbi:unnamed protein product [Staurois parvus]|uniref:Uncharacterized protein n=1 Tax=Staurois parvus TaxID=386267 RepID=A0ABN9ATK6_9NEOB|nr:unnamed protein product [Staurois parvus]
MQGPGRADIVNAGSGESGYSECRVRGGYSEWVPGERIYIVNAGYSECRVPGECRVRDRI